MRLYWGAFTASVLLVAAATTVSAAAAAAADDTTVSDHGVFEWIGSTDGGYFHPDQEFRMDPVSGVAGIFAKKFIPKGEVLLSVPWSLILKSDDMTEEGQMCCGTVKTVAREMKKGSLSEFAPYASYLNSQPDDHVPSAWSAQGKELLQALVGGEVTDTLIPPEEPTEWLEADWYGRCRGSRADKLAAKAAMMVVQRSDDILMIPGTQKNMPCVCCNCGVNILTVLSPLGYDMYNHRNGKYHNTVCTTHHGEKHVTVASRDILPGEQIHNSYNRCKECGGRKVGYGAAGA